MIAAESRSGFPDFVLKTNRDGLLSGGEFIELKDARSYQISSFNSTLPSATKAVSSLSNNMQTQLLEAGEDLDSIPERDVYYLVRGIRLTISSPLAKTVLVSGAFFETIPIGEVLTDAFNQVAVESATDETDASKISQRLDIQQVHFARTRRVEGSSISLRFRVMAQVDPRANLLSDTRFPMIAANTLTMLVHEPQLTDPDLTNQYTWDQPPDAIKSCDAYNHLAQALDEIDKSLKEIIQVSVLRHPMNGPFFMTQAPIHP